MELSTIACAVNFVLLFVLAWQLQLWRAGIVSLGGLNLLTALMPHYVIYPIYLVWMDDNRIVLPTFLPSVLIVTTAMVGFAIGIAANRRRPLDSLRRLTLRLPSLTTQVTLLAAVLVALVAALSLLLGTANPYELLLLARSPQYRDLHRQYELSYLILPATAAIYYLQGTISCTVFTRFPGPRAAAVAAILALIVSQVLLSLGSRSAFFFPLLIAALVMHFQWKRLPSLVVLAVGVIGIPVFVFIRILSAGSSLDQLQESSLITDAEFIALEFISRFSGFNTIQDFLAWFDGRNHVFGATFVDFIQRPFPRFLLPEKPQSLDVFLSYAIHGIPANLGGISLFGGIVEQYYNFGIAGVFFWATVIGYVLSKLHFTLPALFLERRYAAAALIFCNYALIRGFVNSGINTSGTQQLLMTLGTQLAIASIISTVVVSVKVPDARRQVLEQSTARIPQ